MKLQGHDFSRPSVELVIIPRGYDKVTGEKIPDITFICQPILSYEEFDTLVKPPLPPEVIKAGGKKEQNLEDPEYLEACTRHGRSRYDFLFLHSLAATEGLTWETVKMNDPSTWSNWETELKDAGFSIIEIGQIQQGVLDANSLNQARVNEALANFHHGRAAAK